MHYKEQGGRAPKRKPVFEMHYFKHWDSRRSAGNQGEAFKGKGALKVRRFSTSRLRRQQCEPNGENR